MKKLNITFALLFILTGLMTPKTLTAPTMCIRDNVGCVYLEQPTPIYNLLRLSYEPLIRAVYQWESSSGLNLYNKDENAVGPFQIRQVRIDDYNKRTGSNYILEDCYDYDLSKHIFLHYAYGKTYEQAAKNWNGSGPKTIKYWDEVKKLI